MTENEEIISALEAINNSIDIGFNNIDENLSSIKKVLEQSLKDIGLILHAIVDRMP